MCPVTKEEYLMEAQAHIAPWITYFWKSEKLMADMYHLNLHLSNVVVMCLNFLHGRNYHDGYILLVYRLQFAQTLTWAAGTCCWGQAFGLYHRSGGAICYIYIYIRLLARNTQVSAWIQVNKVIWYVLNMKRGLLLVSSTFDFWTFLCAFTPKLVSLKADRSGFPAGSFFCDQVEKHVITVQYRLRRISRI